MIPIIFCRPTEGSIATTASHCLGGSQLTIDASVCAATSIVNWLPPLPDGRGLHPLAVVAMLPLLVDKI